MVPKTRLGNRTLVLSVKVFAEKIKEKEADYVLALKGNHGTFHEDIKLFFSETSDTELPQPPFSYYIPKIDISNSNGFPFFCISKKLNKNDDFFGRENQLMRSIKQLKKIMAGWKSVNNCRRCNSKPLVD